jgi:ribonucleotide reductase beta subunit family protein with ferritin-like domain
MENIHAETYSLQINNIIRDKKEQQQINNAVTDLECLKEKADWVFKWIESDASFAQRLVAFAIVEGVFFSGSFCSIFWIKKYKNKMPGLITSNEFIARDEGMHTDYACLIYNDYVHPENKMSESVIHKMMKQAVEIEKRFICESLPCGLIGMNSKLMIQYIQFVADHLLVKLNYNPVWKVENPFSWMESISLEGKTNFFETRPSQYQKASVLNESNNQEFEITDDF